MPITASIVAFKNDLGLLQKAIRSLLESELVGKIYLIDNSPTDDLWQISGGDRIEYIFTGSNLGYGAGHNVAIRKVIEVSKYHIILNPDLHFEAGTIERLLHFMEENQDVGLVMPKVLFPDGSTQYLCKLLPTPVDLLLRRFLPSKEILEERNEIYELRFTKYNKVIEVPYLSGCFMFVRVAAFKKAGLFDERFFMYFEDTDLTRQINKHYKTMYYPQVSIYHNYEKGSYNNIKLLGYHIVSAIKYFNKWGWVFDKERTLINKKTMERLATLFPPDETESKAAKRTS